MGDQGSIPGFRRSPGEGEGYPLQYSGLENSMVTKSWAQLSHKGSPRILEWVSLSLLQRIFPAQESNRGLLLCRQILYQLSYQDGKGNNWEYTVHCFIYSFIMNVWRRKGKSMTSLPLMYHSLVLAKGLATLNETMRHAVQGHPRQTGHGEEF